MAEDKRLEAGVSHQEYVTSPHTSPHVAVISTNTTSDVMHVPVAEKRLVDAYVLTIGLGFLGAHHFYLRRYGWGALYLCTFGLLGMGWLVDWCRVPFLVKEANKKLRDPNPDAVEYKKLDDAYLVWLPLFGFLGMHHFYLGRIGWGFAYLFTLGFFGVGWFIDAFRLPYLVKQANQRLDNKSQEPPTDRAACEAYVLCLVPFTGLLGAHHYYLRRYGFGALYTCTLGLLGVGWFIDLFRLSCLVSRVNREKEQGTQGQKHVDDAYICCIPLGFLGLHHFYLRRYCWGVLYLCTFGVLGIGWVVDWVRLPCLVADYNKRLQEEQSPIITTTTSEVITPGLVNPGHVGPAQPPAYHPQGPYPTQFYPGQPPQYEPTGGAAGLYPVVVPPGGEESWTSIASSDVGRDPSVCPPSYQEATAPVHQGYHGNHKDESLQNSLNEENKQRI